MNDTSPQLATAIRVVGTRQVPGAVRRAVHAAVASVGGGALGERWLTRSGTAESAGPSPSAWEALTDADVPTLRPLIRTIADRAGLDACVLGVGREARRRLIVLDVDSTLIEQEVIELIAEEAGTRSEVQAITDAAMRGEVDFADSLRARVATLAGLDAAVLADVRRRVTLTPGARTLVAAAHGMGYRVGVVSGGFAEILDPLVASLGLDHARANRLEVSAGRLTGRVAGPIVDRGGKAACLREWAAADEIAIGDSVAVGDGANDLDMLAAAGIGVAFCAKPAVRAAADATLSIRRLDFVLHLLGLAEDEVSDALARGGVPRGH